MLDMAKSSIILFFKGKLFQNPAEVWRQLAIGDRADARGLPRRERSCSVLARRFAGAIAGFIGGAAQPALFRNLKFR